MSGGCKNYICYKIENELVGQMHDKELDDLMKDIAELAHDLEWFEDADYSYDIYKATVDKFKNKWFGKSRSERLKDYIDSSIDELKEELYNMIGAKDDEEI
jgi:hypothetical protein